MAGKESKMSFILSAKADGSFSSTFSKAQQELSKMQQEIQRLNSVQGDISSYQKQQQAIEATTRKLERLKEQQKLLSKQKEEMRAAGQSTTALEREEKKLEQSVDNTNTKLQQQQQKLSQTGERLRQAGVDTNNLTSESKRLEQEMGQLKNQQEQVAEGAQRSGQAMAEAFDAAASAMAAAGIVAGLKQIYDAFAECVGIAAEFESTMSTVEALSGASGGEMEELSAKAKELGATTVFTAQEAGDAMTYMGMAGWKAQDMISGMDGVLNLAAASGEDLAMVSDIVTDNLTAFGLKASDTSRFADVLAAAATNSNTSVSIMGETFKQSAAIAGALGYSVEDVAVAVGLMANAGIKGSIAGTALKNTFNGLLEGATLTGEAFGEYEFSALNADGTTKGFKQTMDELRGIFDQMTGAEKAQNAQLIAGNRSFTGLLSILNATEEDYNKLTSAINDCSGAAERMAQVKLDNLQGDLALANSAAEAFKESVGAALIPILRGLVQAGTEAMSAMASFAGAFPEITQAVAALAAGLGAAVAGIVAFAAAAKVLPLIIGALSANPVILLAGAFAGLAVAGIAGADAAKANRDEVYQLTAAQQKQYQEIQQTTAAYNKAMEGKFQDTEATIALRAHIDELTEAYESNKQTLADWQAENKSVIDSVQELRDGFRDSSNEFADQSAEAQALAYRLDQLAGKSNRTAAEQDQMLSIVDRLNGSVPGLGLAYDQTTGKLNKNTEAIKRMAQAQAKQRYEEEKQQYYQDLYVERERLTDQHREAVENLAAAQERLNALESGQDRGASKQDRQNYQDAAADVATYQQELEDLEGTLDGVNAEIGDFEAEIAGAGNAAGSAEAATQNLESALSNLTTAYTQAYASARESLQGQFSLWEKAAEVSATSLSTLQENIQSQIDYWNNYDTNLETVKQAAQNAGVDLSGIWGHLTDGSADAVNAVAGIAGAINSSADGGKEALQGYVNKYQELQDAQGRAADTIASGADAVQNALKDVGAAMEAGASDLNFADQFTASAQESIDAFTQTLGSADVSAAMAGLQGQVAAGITSIDVSGPATASGTNAGTQFGTSYTGGMAQGVAQGGSAVAAAVGQIGAQITAQSQEATAAMQETMTTGATTAMQAAADATTTGGQAVATAAGAAATSAGTNFSSSMSPSVFAGAASRAMQAAVSAIQAKQGALVAAARAAGQAAAAAFSAAASAVKTDGFASGTKSAPQGLAWVGEKGPELVYFHGGETIVPGDATVSALHGAAMLVGTHGPELMYMQGGETVLTATETASVLRGREHEIQAYADGTRNAREGLALVGEEGPEIVTILPQAMKMMAAWQKDSARSRPDRFQAERMGRIIDSVRNYDAGGQEGGQGAGTPVQIVINISGSPAPETVDRLEDFIYSDRFSARVNDVVAQAQRDRARRAYR